MSLRGALVRTAPWPVKIWLLHELARVTAAGFGSPAPRLTGRSLEGRMEQYARFTADRAAALVVAGDAAAAEATRQRLHRGATGLGARVRRALRLRKPAQVVEVFAALYGHIGIHVAGSAAGEIVIDRCAFAAYFSEPVCGVVGALDEGVVAGLSGGGRLQFVERLTGGAPCCRAHFAGAEPIP